MDEMALRRVFADNLRREIGVRGVRKADLARQVGISPARISEMIRGDGNVTVDTIERIAVALHIPAASLLLPADAEILAEPS
jgi:transcriptional regulator with XRE-family HTH domain